MNTKLNFIDLPNSRRSYAAGEAVFCIPSWGKSKDPILAVVSDPWEKSHFFIRVWTVDGEEEVDVDFCRPATPTVLSAWANMLQAEKNTQYEVVMICQAPQYTEL